MRIPAFYYGLRVIYKYNKDCFFMRFYSQMCEQWQPHQLNQVIGKADFLIFSKGFKSIAIEKSSRFCSGSFNQ